MCFSPNYRYQGLSMGGEEGQEWGKGSGEKRCSRAGPQRLDTCNKELSCFHPMAHLVLDPLSCL